MDKFKKGDIGYHKATLKRLVIAGFDSGRLWVTTEDDKSHSYEPEEVYTEKEWIGRNQNTIDSLEESYN